MASIDINKTIDEIVTKAREEYDRFVFETIAPYCEEVTKMEITKADLEEALTVWKSYKEGAFERKKGKWIIKRTKESQVIFPHCSCCDWYSYNWVKHPFCPNCGARMEGAEE